MKRTGFIVDLTCDWCTVTSQFAAKNEYFAEDLARRKGWKFVETSSEMGTFNKHRCPKCDRSNHG